MDSQRIRQIVDEAATATEGIDEPLRTAAFQTVLQWLLAQTVTTAPSVPPAVQQPAGVTEPTTQPTTLNEFVASLAIGSHLDRLTAILYCNLHNANNDRMTREELLDAYGSLRERRPKNLSDLLAKCIRKGHVIDAPDPKDGKKAWQITPTGERYIETLRQAE